MRSLLALIALSGLGIAVGLSGCESDPDRSADVSSDGGANADPSGSVSPPELDSDEAGAALEEVVAYADDWSIVLTDDEVACLAGKLDEEFESSDGSFARNQSSFFLIGCRVDVGEATGGEGRSPLEEVVDFLLVDEGVDTDDETLTCATEALVAGFGAGGFIDLVTGGTEPSDDDDAIARAAFDSCGLDGATIVDG